MSWEVTAKVSGGCKYSTEETEAYMRAAKALSHQADALNRAHDSVPGIEPSSFPPTPMRRRPSPRCPDQAPIAMPRITSNCHTTSSSNNVTPMQARWEPWRQDCLSYRR